MISEGSCDTEDVVMTENESQEMSPLLNWKKKSQYCGYIYTALVKMRDFIQKNIQTFYSSQTFE